MDLFLAAIVTVIAVSSSGHIEVTMVPMTMSLTDANSDWTDSDVFCAIWNNSSMRPLPRTPNKQVTRIRQWTKIESKARPNRPRER